MRRKRLKYLKVFTLINIVLLLFNIVSYFLLTGPGVFHSQAAVLSMSLSVEEEAPVQPEQPQEPPNQYNPPSQ